MMTDMTDELERLLKAATPGPWKHISGKRMVFVVAPECHVYSNRDNDDGEGPHHPNTIKRWNADAALIVAAINALPGLIESARRVERLEAALEKIANGDGIYGMQAGEYKQIARAALKEPSDG